MFQKLIFVGNLGRDPELRYTSGGKPVTTLSVAVNNQYTNAQNEPVKETTWFRVSVWDKQAEACAQYLAKGRQVLVEGRLQADPSTGGPRLFERNDGTMGAAFEVNASAVRFLGGKSEGNGNGQDAADEIPL